MNKVEQTAAVCLSTRNCPERHRGARSRPCAAFANESLQERDQRCVGQIPNSSRYAGQYKLFAWEEVENTAWLNADFMRGSEERGTPVQIKEGETVTVTLPRISN